MHMEAQIEDLTMVTEQLIVLMDQETSLLHERRHEDIRGLQVEKAQLAHAYEGHLRGLRERPENIQNVSPSLLDRLKTSNIAFQKATQSNALALKAAMEANNHVLRAVAKAVADSNANGDGYERSGKTSGKSGPGVSVTLDQEF